MCSRVECIVSICNKSFKSFGVPSCWTDGHFSDFRSKIKSCFVKNVFIPMKFCNS